MIRRSCLFALSSLFLSITINAHAGVIDNPSAASQPASPVVAIPGVQSGLPANPLSLPFNPPPLAPGLTPLPSPLPAPSISAVSAVSAAEPFSSPRTLNAFWDGLRVPSLETPEPPSAPLPGITVSRLPVPSPARAAPWLSTPDPRVAAALDRAVILARTTRAGRRALAAAESALSSQGRPLPVLTLDLGRNYGEYDYLARSMRLHSSLFKPGREADLAGTLVHELTHVAQHAAGMPSNALELEIEAHLQDLDMMSQLGLSPRKGTFARQALDLLAQGPAKFIELLQAAVPGSVFLGDSSLDDVLDQFEDDLSSQRARRSKLAAALVPVIERDLARLRTAEGASAYRAFSRRVLALLKRRAAAAAR